ncbi:MAG: hypothetical protein HYS24_02465 [Ignavibacteriales bacterium]|nr:hypothetical protein [Ignavibacteriales bacterium]
MKKIISIFLLSFSLLFAQEGGGIELPDFVITGNENVTVPKMEKSQPNLIPLLSKDFFTPSNISDDQTSISLPKIDNQVVSIPNYRQMTKALLRLNAGIYTWPSGEFYYNDWTGNLSYNAHLYGLNELEYIKYAGMSYAGIGLGSKYFVNHEADFLPGLEIDLNGNYLYESYNFYGSDKRSLERKTDEGNISLSFNFASDSYRNFGISFDNEYYNQKDNSISENIFSANAFVNLKLQQFDFLLNGGFKNQAINSKKYSEGNNSFFVTNASLAIYPFSFLYVRGGISYAESEGNTFFAPNAYASLKMSKRFSVYGEFAPFTEFVTLKDFRNANRYYQLNNFVDLFIENKFNIKLAAKYEYEKYFEISGGFGYVNTDNNFYFEDDSLNGIFAIHKTDSEKSFAFLNLLFRKGPFGEFYGNIIVQNISGNGSKNLPYNSEFLAALSYSYNWANFGLNLTLNYFGKSYSDYQNTSEIPDAINLNANFKYKLFENFDLTFSLQNLINDKYYYFRNYKAKPFDLIAGIEFRW